MRLYSAICRKRFRGLVYVLSLFNPAGIRQDVQHLALDKYFEDCCSLVLLLTSHVGQCDF